MSLILVGVAMAPTAVATNDCDGVTNQDIDINYGPGGAGFCLGPNHSFTVAYNASGGLVIYVYECTSPTSCTQLVDEIGVTIQSGEVCVIVGGDPKGCVYP